MSVQLRSYKGVKRDRMRPDIVLVIRSRYSPLRDHPALHQSTAAFEPTVVAFQKYTK